MVIIRSIRARLHINWLLQSYITSNPPLLHPPIYFQYFCLPLATHIEHNQFSTIATAISGSNFLAQTPKLQEVTIKMSRPTASRSQSTNWGGANTTRTLEGRLALVTGASRGIGAATCENLASKGASLIMNYTSDSSASKTADLAKSLEEKYNIAAFPVQADMGSENGPAHIVEMALNRFKHPKTGKFQVDIVVQNAGVASNRSIEKCDAEDFAWLYNVNVRGPLFLMKAVIPYLPNDRSGRVVNVSSVSASLGFHEQSV